ncbi:MAG: peptidoglycan-associated lipoprotein Pal [Alphaproteobacteria bacterium]
MRKFMVLFAALLMVSACETTGDNTDSNAMENSGEGLDLNSLSDIQRDLVVNVGDRVFFGFDQYNLNKDAQEILQLQADWLAQNALVNVTIEGHCDERGTREYNLALGERRANAAKKYLLSLGVSKDRVNTVSYGKERPVASENDEETHSRNRRSVTVVTQ